MKVFHVATRSLVFAWVMLGIEAVSDTDNEPVRPSDKAAEAVPIIVQGGSLRTWPFRSPTTQRVQVVLETEGSPLNANVELWQGPDNTPQKMRIQSANGALRPFRAIVETPWGENTIAVRNTASKEYLLTATVTPANDVVIASDNPGVIVPAGATKNYNMDPLVESVQVVLKTDGRPLNAQVELLQGPNNVIQAIDLYTEDGLERPFYAIIETPGTVNVIRVVNTDTTGREHPLRAWVDRYSAEEDNNPPEEDNNPTRRMLRQNN